MAGMEDKNFSFALESLAISSNDFDCTTNCFRNMSKRLFVLATSLEFPYYGCPYKGNELGNANVILIPKTKRFDTYAITSKCNDNEPCWEKVRQEIASLSIEELNKNFNAVIFIIDKKYLEYTPDLETSYNPKYPYKEDAYVLENGKWSIRKTYTVTDEIEQEIHRLQDRYIDSLVEKYRFRE